MSLKKMVKKRDKQYDNGQRERRGKFYCTLWLLFMLASFFFAIYAAFHLNDDPLGIKNSKEEIYPYRQITIYSLEGNKIIYNGWGKQASHYWIGTGVSFYDKDGNKREIAGNAIIGKTLFELLDKKIKGATK